MSSPTDGTLVFASVRGSSSIIRNVYNISMSLDQH